MTSHIHEYERLTLLTIVRENVQLTSNLTAVQSRCTELTEELRAVKAERDDLLARMPMLQASDTIPAPPIAEDVEESRPILGVNGAWREFDICRYVGEPDPRGRALTDAIRSGEIIDADDDEPSVSDTQEGA